MLETYLQILGISKPEKIKTRVPKSPKIQKPNAQKPEFRKAGYPCDPKFLVIMGFFYSFLISVGLFYGYSDSRVSGFGGYLIFKYILPVAIQCNAITSVTVVIVTSFGGNKIFGFSSCAAVN